MPHFSDMCFIDECCAVNHTLLQLSGADANPYISGIFEVKSMASTNCSPGCFILARCGQQIKEQKLSPSKLKSLEGPAGKMNDFLSKARVLTEQEVQRRKQLKSSK